MPCSLIGILFHSYIILAFFTFVKYFFKKFFEISTKVYKNVPKFFGIFLFLTKLKHFSKISKTKARYNNGV